MIHSLRSSGPMWAVCLLLALVASVFGRPDIPVDETRSLGVAWEMWSSGDLLVPQANGQPYFSKPPLLFWLINGGWAVFGVNDWWPRAISTLFSFASLLLTVALAHRLWPRDRGVGAKAGWVLLGSVFWLFFSTAVVFDVMLTTFVLVALLGALRALDGELAKGWGLFALGLGLGILSKGPAILLHVLPVLLMAPWWGRSDGGWKRWYLGLALGVLAGLLLVMAWVLPVILRGGEAFAQTIIASAFAAVVAGDAALQRPVYWYLLLLPALLFPWIFWLGSWRALAQALHWRRDSGVRFCVAWLLPALVVFSLVGTKQVHYLLPLLPAFALLLAFGSGHAVRTRLLSRLPLALALAAVGLVFITGGWWAERYWFGANVSTGWLVTGCVFALVAAALFTKIEERRRIMVFSLLFQSGMLAALVFFLPSLWSGFDVTPMARYLNALEADGVPVAHASAYNDQFHFYGRLNRPLDEIPRGQEKAWLADHPEGMVISYLTRHSDLSKVRPVFFQPYLEKTVVLVDKDSVARLPKPVRAAVQ